MTKSVNVFLSADQHFGHAGVCRFMKADGITKLRPWDDPDEMDEALVTSWNAKVRPQDKVYFLGDVVINRKALPTIGRLNGRKILIKGNHDIFKLSEYAEYFDDVRSSHILGSYIMTHIPLHPMSIERWKANIHGHLHDRVVVEPTHGNPDQRYICVSMEHTNFAPLEFSEIESFAARQHLGLKS